jgi:hypothetical protein
MPRAIAPRASWCRPVPSHSRKAFASLASLEAIRAWPTQETAFNIALCHETQLYFHLRDHEAYPVLCFTQLERRLRELVLCKSSHGADASQALCHPVEHLNKRIEAVQARLSVRRTTLNPILVVRQGQGQTPAIAPDVASRSIHMHMLMHMHTHIHMPHFPSTIFLVSKTNHFSSHVNTHVNTHRVNTHIVL